MGRLARDARGSARVGADVGVRALRSAKGAGRVESGGRVGKMAPGEWSARISPAVAKAPGRGVLLPRVHCRPSSSPRPQSFLLPFLPLPWRVGGGRLGSRDTMSDSEEESQDRQLKIVVLGDGTSGKVSPRAGSPSKPAATLARPRRPQPPPWVPGPLGPSPPGRRSLWLDTKQALGKGPF